MSILKSIISGVLEDQVQRQLSTSELEERISNVAPPLDVLADLRRSSFSIIAEVKRSSPSKGEIAKISSPEVLARQYQDGGASVISVLTEKRRFGGSLEDFSKVRAEVKIPLLRKDFIVNEYLVRESRAFGADLVLLIMAALDDHELRDLFNLSNVLGMEALIEVHDQQELERALHINPKIIGVNARNLKTLEIDKNNFPKLLPLIPSGIYRIAESGMSNPADGFDAFKAGADGILVGEALVKSENPSKSVGEFLNVAKGYGKVDC